PRFSPSGSPTTRAAVRPVVNRRRRQRGVRQGANEGRVTASAASGGGRVTATGLEQAQFLFQLADALGLTEDVAVSGLTGEALPGPLLLSEFGLLAPFVGLGTLLVGLGTLLVGLALGLVASLDLDTDLDLGFLARLPGLIALPPGFVPLAGDLGVVAQF